MSGTQSPYVHTIHKRSALTARDVTHMPAAGAPTRTVAFSAAAETAPSSRTLRLACLLGSGLAIFVAWNGATVAGYTAEEALGDPVR